MRELSIIEILVIIEKIIFALVMLNKNKIVCWVEKKKKEHGNGN